MVKRSYVAQVHGGSENTAEYHLKNQSFETCLLLYRDGRMRRLFPGYIFVWFDIDDPFQRWRAINSTRGVLKLLPRVDEFPRPLPEGFVEKLRDVMANEDWSPERAEEIAYGYLPGEEVRIALGPLAGMKGELVKFSKGSAILLLTLLSRKREVTIPKLLLERRADERAAAFAVAS